MPLVRFLRPLVVLLAANQALGKLPWGETKFLFTFGDSYSADGYNVSAGVDSPVPGRTSSNGLNWVQFLGGKYNVTDTQVFDLASGGATIDAALVPPYLPTVLSIVNQVAQFKHYLAPKPAGAVWDSSNSLFAFWIGINDVGNSLDWTNITGHEPQFYSTLLKQLDTQLEELYTEGARSFLFLTVPPTDRAPLLISQGPKSTQKLKRLIGNYNQQLTALAGAFKERHADLHQVTVFDTQPIFNTLLDNAEALGYVNATGYCEAYQNGIPGTTAQISPCAPVTSYFWLNPLHPLFTVHDIIARAITTVLA